MTGGNNNPKPRDYWNKEENIINEFKHLIEKLGRFPTSKDFPGLFLAINKRGKKIKEYQELFGFKSIKRNYWTNFENLKKEIENLIENNLGKFPNLCQIEKELGSRAKVIVLKNGGIKVLANKMGYEYIGRKNNQFIKTTDGHFVLSGYEYIVDEFLYSRGIKHEVGGLISKDFTYKYDFKIHDWFIEIWGFENNSKNEKYRDYNKRKKIKKELYENLGLNLISIEKSIFKKSNKKIIKDLENIICDKLDLNKEQIFEIDLDNQNNHNCIWNKNLLIEKIANLIKKIGRFPRLKEICLEIKGAQYAVTKFGGIQNIAKEMGYLYSKKRKWTEDEIYMQLNEIVKSIKKFPSYKYLQLQNKNLSRAITKNKGFKFWKNMFDNYQ